jgi:protein-S-isoprenylcysteine O-methyltransferase Ste14
MLRTLNFLVYIAASAASAILYVASVRPAQMEYEKVPDPYAHCRRYRSGSLVFKVLAFLFFIATRYMPLASVYAAPFAWPRWFSFLLALLLGIPGLTLLITGLQDLGSESFTPAKATKLKTRGIYKTIRHPQSYQALLWPAVALGMNSQYLMALASPWLLLEIIMVMAEETDLLIRFGDAYIKYRAKTGMFLPKSFLGFGFLEPVKERINDLFNPDND